MERYEDFARISAMMKNSGLAQHFEAVLSVDAAKVFKPDPRVYQLAVDHLGLDKTAIGFVSSNYWDVAGAKAFGFNVFWLNRKGAQPDELGLAPTPALTRLTDLAYYLES